MMYDYAPTIVADDPSRSGLSLDQTTAIRDFLQAAFPTAKTISSVPLQTTRPLAMAWHPTLDRFMNLWFQRLPQTRATLRTPTPMTLRLTVGYPHFGGSYNPTTHILGFEAGLSLDSIVPTPYEIVVSQGDNTPNSTPKTTSHPVIVQDIEWAGIGEYYARPSTHGVRDVVGTPEPGDPNRYSFRADSNYPSRLLTVTLTF